MTDAKPTKRALHGVLLIDKSVGPSSHAVLGRARRLWRAEKAGHTGTLDPLASGLLPICFGAATKFAQLCLDADKTYRATLHLGVTREGGDREGAVLLDRSAHVDALNEARVREVVGRFVGQIDQVPPMHSALKHEGKPLYELARAGKTVERAPRSVTIHRIDWVSFEVPLLTIDVHCSKGTYIRVLGEDIGEALGCGAHLAALRRLGTGDFDVKRAIKLDDAERLTDEQRDAHLLPTDVLVQAWPTATLDADNAGRFLTGLRRRVQAPDAEHVRVYGPAPQANTANAPLPPAFLGVAHIQSNELIPDRLLSPLEVAQSQARFTI